MTVKVCPECDAEYVGTVQECADCGATLAVVDAVEPDDVEPDDAEVDDAEVDDATADDATADDATADDATADDTTADDAAVSDGPEVAQLGYEFDEWDGNGRVLLDRLLTGQGLVHVWEGTTLVVRAADEEAVDTLIEQVESAELPELDPDREQVVYELEGWSDEQRAALVEALVEAALPHAFDEDDDLVVHEDDEEQVDPILDRIDTASAPVAGLGEDVADLDDEPDDDDDATDGPADADDADEADDDDGLAAQDAMSELFVAADRLMHDPDDHEGVLSLGDAARMVEGLGLPYGFAPAVWKDITARSVALRELLEAVETDDDEVIEAATGLRTVLRQYV